MQCRLAAGAVEDAIRVGGLADIKASRIKVGRDMPFKAMLARCTLGFMLPLLLVPRSSKTLRSSLSKQPQLTPMHCPSSLHYRPFLSRYC
jgi:hypothetical protein